VSIQRKVKNSRGLLTDEFYWRWYNQPQVIARIQPY